MPPAACQCTRVHTGRPLASARKTAYTAYNKRAAAKRADFSALRTAARGRDKHMQEKGRIILVTGGARSGKSRFAESLYFSEREVVYIATAQITDAEMAERVALHRASRPEGWTTAECTRGLAQAAAGAPCVLLDCVTILTSNIMFELTAQYEVIPRPVRAQVESEVCAELGSLIETVRKTSGTLVMVTNEVGSAIVPDNHVARVYRDIVGRVNQFAGTQADEVYLVVCGQPLKIK